MLNRKKGRNVEEHLYPLLTSYLVIYFMNIVQNTNLRVTQGHAYSLCRWFNGSIMSICIISIALTTPYVPAGNVRSYCFLFPTECTLERYDKRPLNIL